jgi:hypothetical protein
MERDNLEDLCLDGRIIFKWILNKSGGRAGTGFICLRKWTSGWLL